MNNDRQALLLPIWKGETTYHETGMFIGKQDRFPLLFAPKQILSVMSYDRTVRYREGDDFVVTDDGCIALTEHTTIPYMTEEEYYPDDPEGFLLTMYRGREVSTYWGEGDTMTKWQVSVTYTHAEPTDAFLPPDRSDHFARLLSKLERGEDVSVLFFGDSITVGGNSSELIGIPPYMPAWPMLACEYLAERYGYTLHCVETGLERTCPVPTEDIVFGTRGTLTYINTAVGGWKSDQAVEHFDERVARWLKEYKCDLFVLGFGMNDREKTADEVMANLRTVIDRARPLQPDLSLLAVATMLPNPNATRKWYGKQETFEAAMEQMISQYAADGLPCAVVPMTSMSRFVLRRKRFCDYSGNNVNHPNDFMIRLYAQTLLQTVLGDL